jgi:hypothetical protein
MSPKACRRCQINVIDSCISAICRRPATSCYLKTVSTNASSEAVAAEAKADKGKLTAILVPVHRHLGKSAATRPLLRQ